MSTTEDLEALNRYFEDHAGDKAAQNGVAQDAIKAWRTWWTGLSFWDKSVSNDATLVEAKARRDKFNQAMGQPNLIDMGFVPLETRTPMTADDVAKTFAGGGAPPTIRKGIRGAAVGKWQEILKVTVDRNFGSGTETATKAWQKARGITPDGVVGPLTWSKAGVTSVSQIAKPPQGLPGLTAPVPVVKTTGPVNPEFSPAPPVPTGSFAPIPQASAVAKPGFARSAVAKTVTKPAGSKPVTGITAKPALSPGFKAAVPATVAAKTVLKPAVIAQSGLVSWASGLPTWFKVLLGVGATAGVVKSLSHNQAHHKRA